MCKPKQATPPAWAAFDPTRSVTLYVPVQVNEQFLSDVLTTAVEGGINYWVDRADSIERAQDLSVLAVFGLREHDETRKWNLDLETVKRGIEVLVSGKVKVNPTILGYITKGITQNDPGEIDADAADVIIQAGLFREIVYG